MSLLCSLDSKAEERKYVLDVLTVNGYTKTFLRYCQKPVTTSNTLDKKEPVTGFAVISHIHSVTEPIKRILKSHNFKVTQIPFQTLGHIFGKPEDPVTKEQQTDAIYSIPCNDCDHEYIVQTKRQFGTRLREHQKAVFFYVKENSALSEHTCLTKHGIKLSSLIDITTSAFVWKPGISTPLTLI